MNIDILCHDGSPLEISLNDLWGSGMRGVGVGGSEYALLTMCEAWFNAGHRVRLYNDPRDPRGSPFGQFPIDQFDHQDKSRDILVNFRSPNERAIVSTGLKVWWSCDQYTVGDYAKFAPNMDKIVCISDFHKDYFQRVYNIQNAIAIDLPVRTHDFADMDVEKVPNRLIFTSVPDRGLKYLRDTWMGIKASVPEASLVITSDYRLWGLHEPRNEKFRAHWIGVDDVIFLGAVTRDRLIEEQLKANIYAYPNTYDELFCVSCAEAQASGAYPITSATGALATTNMGTIVPGNPTDGRSAFLKYFRKEIVELLSNPDVLKKKQEDIRKRAIERFNVDNILKQWDEKVFT
jgi:glycosyltransferase involved in cell wall biosynthesis